MPHRIQSLRQIPSASAPCGQRQYLGHAQAAHAHAVAPNTAVPLGKRRGAPSQSVGLGAAALAEGQGGDKHREVCDRCRQCRIGHFVNCW